MNVKLRNCGISGSLLLLLLTLSVGCGYSFRGSGSVLPKSVQTVAIAPVDNQTTQRGLSIELEEALRSEFERYGVVNVIDRTEEADAVLQATILDLGTRVKNVTSDTDIVLEQELMMRVAATLRTSNGILLYENKKITTRESFASTSDVVVTSSSSFAQGGISSSALAGLESRELSRGQQREVLDDLIEETSRRIYLEAVAEDF